jgi:hypothetical protein
VARAVRDADASAAAPAIRDARIKSEARSEVERITQVLNIRRDFTNARRMFPSLNLDALESRLLAPHLTDNSDSPRNDAVAAFLSGPRNMTTPESAGLMPVIRDQLAKCGIDPVQDL